MDLERIRSLISRGLIDRAIKELKKSLSPDHVKFNEFTSLSARWHNLYKENIEGLVDPEEKREVADRIINDMLELISVLENPEKESKNKSGSKTKYFIAGAVIIFILILLIKLISETNNSSQIEANSEADNIGVIHFNVPDTVESLHLIFKSNSLNRYDTFKIAKSEIINELKSSLKFYYGISPPDSIVNDTAILINNINEYLYINNQRMTEEYQSIDSLNIKDYDVIQYVYSISTRPQPVQNRLTSSASTLNEISSELSRAGTASMINPQEEVDRNHTITLRFSDDSFEIQDTIKVDQLRMFLKQKYNIKPPARTVELGFQEESISYLEKLYVNYFELMNYNISLKEAGIHDNDIVYIDYQMNLLRSCYIPEIYLRFKNIPENLEKIILNEDIVGKTIQKDSLSSLIKFEFVGRCNPEEYVYRLILNNGTTELFQALHKELIEEEKRIFEVNYDQR